MDYSKVVCESGAELCKLISKLAKEKGIEVASIELGVSEDNEAIQGTIMCFVENDTLQGAFKLKATVINTEELSDMPVRLEVYGVNKNTEEANKTFEPMCTALGRVFGELIGSSFKYLILEAKSTNGTVLRGDLDE